MGRGFPVGSVVKNPSAIAGHTGDLVSFSGLGRSLAGRNGNPPKYSCLENFLDRGVWWAQIVGHDITHSNNIIIKENCTPLLVNGDCN